MVQKARPVADVSDDGWAPTPVYAQVNEPTFDDGSYVTAPALPVASFEVRLDALGPPATGPGQPAPALTIRLKGPGTVLVELLQNTTLIASRTYDTTAGFAPYTMTLTAAEAVTVLWPQDGSDPDLRVRVTAYASSSSSESSTSSSSSSVPNPRICDCGCGPDGVPTRWRVTISGVTNGTCLTCSGYNGTYVVPTGGGSCAWQLDVGEKCAGGGRYLFLGTNSVANTLTLVIGLDLSHSTWEQRARLADGAFCGMTGPMEMTLLDPGASCDWSSATVQIEPDGPVTGERCPVETLCCSDAPVPAVLYVEFMDPVGTFVPSDGVVAPVYYVPNSSPPEWRNDAMLVPTGAATPMSFRLRCTGAGTYGWNADGSYDNGAYRPDFSASFWTYGCDPFLLEGYLGSNDGSYVDIVITGTAP